MEQRECPTCGASGYLTDKQLKAHFAKQKLSSDDRRRILDTFLNALIVVAIVVTLLGMGTILKTCSADSDVHDAARVEVYNIKLAECMDVPGIERCECLNVVAPMSPSRKATPDVKRCYYDFYVKRADPRADKYR